MADDEAAAKDKGATAHPEKVPYTVYIVDLLGDADRKSIHPGFTREIGPGVAKAKTVADTIKEITALLESWMTLVLEKVDPQLRKKQGWDHAAVRWVTSFPEEIHGTELYAYVCQAGKSRLGADAASEQIKGGFSGITKKSGGKVLCEIYPEAAGQGQGAWDQFVKVMAKIIFHEWMHIKLEMAAPPAADIHKRKGESFGNYANMTSGPPNQPSDQDVLEMAKKLGSSFTFDA